MVRTNGDALVFLYERGAAAAPLRGRARPQRQRRASSTPAAEARSTPFVPMGHVHAQRIPRPPDAPPDAYTPHKRVVAVDTGRITLAYCVEWIPARNEWRTWKLTNAEYRDALRMDLHLAHVHRACAAGGLHEHWARLAEVSPKTASLEEFLEYMRETARAREATLAVTLTREWAVEKFKARAAKERALMSFWARVRAGLPEDGTAGVACVVAYGDADFSSSGRGNRSAPTVSLYHACVAVMGPACVRYVTEHRRSKCCCGCGHLLQEVRTSVVSHRQADRDARLAKRVAAGWARPRGWNPEWHTLRGLKCCDNAECDACIRDRDYNAARNIHAPSWRWTAARRCLRTWRAGATRRATRSRSGPPSASSRSSTCPRTSTPSTASSSSACRPTSGRARARRCCPPR